MEVVEVKRRPAPVCLCLKCYDGSDTTETTHWAVVLSIVIDCRAGERPADVTQHVLHLRHYSGNLTSIRNFDSPSPSSSRVFGRKTAVQSAWSMFPSDNRIYAVLLVADDMSGGVDVAPVGSPATTPPAGEPLTQFFHQSPGHCCTSFAAINMMRQNAQVRGRSLARCPRKGQRSRCDIWLIRARPWRPSQRLATLV